MIRSEKKLAELKKVLDSGKHTEIEQGIVMLRDAEPFEGALLLLAAFYGRTKDDVLRNSITGFFNDLKEKSATGEVVEALLAAHDTETMAMIAASCWQSGLDYSEYATTFAGIFVRGDYLTSLECFTVIDNCASQIPDGKRKAIVDMLVSATDTMGKDKRELNAELISILNEEADDH